MFCRLSVFCLSVCLCVCLSVLWATLPEINVHSLLDAVGGLQGNESGRCMAAWLNGGGLSKMIAMVLKGLLH